MKHTKNIKQLKKEQKIDQEILDVIKHLYEHQIGLWSRQKGGFVERVVFYAQMTVRIPRAVYLVVCLYWWIFTKRIDWKNM